ncbi:TPA: hypothetical protein LA742_001638 [Clostridium botulinum]|uniref:Transmembrane protein n=1 Tax=Clostridium botulinum B str. Osaka05 TaxID=1407017 RepID=A0A0S6U0E9_CLOBO|nr:MULTISPECIES: hypothetical protein [Clostridium]EJE7234643.1 hypothetical protein [Clostridium botulinum]EKO1913505.1 hypothetical protein [Clostridium botulinum]EKO2043561.1 hypothetical protein [Clostridium botulinum]EKS4343333.1 hypothetical protein [Clostridium botulinum]EKS4394378.1 hypothetical protein [Clostridium botulinum]
MDLNKGLRNQKRSYKRFVVIMSFIFILLPLILYLYNKIYDIFYVSYLIIIEVLIIMAIIIRTDREKLKFEYSNNRLKIVLGIMNRKLNIVCDKVALVHIEQYNNIYDVEDFRIVLLTTSKFRNKRIIKVNEKFLKLHNYTANFYYKLKKIDPEKDFYYTIIKRGGLKKYYLLDALYRTCVYAHFTEECIEKIKELRKEIEMD